MNKRFFAILFLFAIAISSCDPNRIFEENQSVENNTWKYEDVKTFSFDIQDTTSQVNIYVNLRTTTDYPYNNIYMYLYSEYPGGISLKDTLQFLLAEPDGKWLGENSGTVIEFKSLVSSGGQFTRSGTYTFRLQQAMEENDLTEIVDVGMRIEKMVD